MGVPQLTVIDAARKILDALKELHVEWDGRKAILEMKENGCRHWRQMEWIGFYFEFLCQERLSGMLQMPGPCYGRVSFDGFLSVPWDFKAHVVNSGSKVIVNDWQAIHQAVAAHGCMGLLLAEGTAIYNDYSMSFKKWHDNLKGGRSIYEQERIARGAWSRIRKTSFRLVRLSCIKIDENLLSNSLTFQKGFRNANGRPRRPKLVLDLDVLPPQNVLSAIDFI